jgi:hypothetical protein
MVPRQGENKPALKNSNFLNITNMSN